jgi:crotonobetainyl-CoA:carnitine CoA-transferase CaiB-like acyl-CoA transferase
MSRMPLEGYRILDLTHWLVGGGATVLLADMGADVIKIESPSAPEPARNAPVSSRERELGLNHNLEITSRNKRSVTLNLKSDEGKQIFYKLVESADVVTENFRPGVMERLGIDHATLAKYNSSIILASVNGFGSQGPDALLGSFDVIGSARSGLLHLLSPPDAMRYVGPVALADEAGALVFCISILSALAARGIDGQGQHVETSQLAALLQLQTLPIHSYLFSGDYFRDGEVWPGERDRAGMPLFNIFLAGDGEWLALGIYDGEYFWPALCKMLDIEHLETDSRFVDDGARRENAEELISILDDRFATRPRAEWVRLLKEKEMLFAPVQKNSELLDDPQVAANGYFQEVDHPSAGKVTELAPPVKFSRTKPVFRYSAPAHGQHTDEVLTECGYSKAELEAFRFSGVI